MPREIIHAHEYSIHALGYCRWDRSVQGFIRHNTYGVYTGYYKGIGTSTQDLECTTTFYGAYEFSDRGKRDAKRLPNLHGEFFPEKRNNRVNC